MKIPICKRFTIQKVENYYMTTLYTEMDGKKVATVFAILPRDLKGLHFTIEKTIADFKQDFENLPNPEKTGAFSKILPPEL